MSVGTIRRDCGEEIQNLLRNARTMDDDKLVSGMCNPGARLHHGELEMPVVGVAQVFHESATEGFSNYSPIVRNSVQLTEDKAYYPVGGDNNVHTAELLQALTTTAVAADVTLIPTAGNIAEIEYMYLISSATAAGREADLYLYDGVTSVPIWQSGAAAIATTDAYQIWPIDVSTLMTGAVDLIGTTLTVHAGTYLRLVSTGLVAAETHTVIVHWKAKRVAGFE